jgi:hypothetical protein
VVGCSFLIQGCITTLIPCSPLLASSSLTHSVSLPTKNPPLSGSGDLSELNSVAPKSVFLHFLKHRFERLGAHLESAHPRGDEKRVRVDDCAPGPLQRLLNVIGDELTAKVEFEFFGWGLGCHRLNGWHHRPTRCRGCRETLAPRCPPHQPLRGGGARSIRGKTTPVADESVQKPLHVFREPVLCPAFACIERRGENCVGNPQLFKAHSVHQFPHFALRE